MRSHSRRVLILQGLRLVPLFLCVVCGPLFGQLSPLRYTLRFPAPETHYVEVEAEIPTDGRRNIELMMAVWTPGSYLLREYSGKLEEIRAGTPAGKALEISKSRKNRWRIETGGEKAVRVSYRLYCREMTVRHNWVSRDFAMLNGAATFLALLDSDGTPAERPYTVQLVLPSYWSRSHSALPRSSPNEPGHYVADDFDTLVDSPIVAGNPAIYEFEAGGKKHYLVNEGEGGVWDSPRSAADIEKIVRECISMWGQTPYGQYSFLNMITESGGGIEHKASTLVMSSRWATRVRKDYLSWLGVMAHEFFHVWNGKRLRPSELGPFDYERENYTTALWIAEGFTTYYEPLLVQRAGLSSQKEFLEAISRFINALQTTPGRLEQPLAESSYDAWVKFYRPSENSPNATVDYYIKGALVGFLLDAEIRKSTAGAKTLDDAMRLAYERYSGEEGFKIEQFQQTVSEAACKDLTGWLSRAAETTAELDYSTALEWYGLRFKDPGKKKDDGDSPGGAPKEANGPDDKPKAWLGFRSQIRDGRLTLTEVRRGTPAYDAGLNVDDEILAIDDYRVPPGGFEARLEKYQPGQTVSLLIARRDRLIRLYATFAASPQNPWQLEPNPQATAEQKKHLEDWLSSSRGRGSQP